ncbi:beta strand repeat-containing protein [Kitasatospora sp. NPDC056531]|uniref:beta strand repeat-containing protein n=1 Tax=Kitasatospora sp. NPDC056531 TaxID=3345856 RepID=UPI00368E172F
MPHPAYMPFVLPNTPGFSSPVSNSVRLTPLPPAPSGAPAAPGPVTTGTGRTLYASFAGAPCTQESGTGTQASPYCLLQDAVNAAQPGDTVDVLSSTGSSSQESVTVRTSGISIVGTGPQAWVSAGNANSGKPALVLDHVSNVTVSNLMLTSWGNATAVEVIGSTGVTIDSSFVSTSNNPTGADALTIDGASSNVTVSRTYVDTGFSRTGARAISVASGARTVSLAGDVLADAGITATGVNGLNVVGNTIQRGCGSAVDLEGTSSGVSVENNLIEDANPSTDYMGTYQSNCSGYGLTWAPDVTVSPGSAAGTTADYNDFYVYGNDATAPYSWAGTTYPTLAGFQSAVAQGAHDTNDTKQATSTGLRPNTSSLVDIQPQVGSAAINSANPAAPGALGSDFFGTSPHTSRGAEEFDANPNLAVALTGTDNTAYSVYVGINATSDVQTLTYDIAWGDGTTTHATGRPDSPPESPHTYPQLGTYTAKVTVTDQFGNAVTNSITVTTSGSEYVAFGPTRLLDSRDGSGTPQVGAYSTTRVQVAGANGIPAGATAAVLNVTVTGTTGAGHVTVFGDGSAAPTTSNVNYMAGQTVPNMVVAPVGAGGYVDLVNAGPSLDLVVDITGYFVRSSAAGYTPLSPSRLVDTRYGTGAPQSQVGAGQALPVRIAGAAGGQLPTSGITAVALNVTVTNPGTAGHLTVYPGGQQAPNASNLNFTAGQTVANSVVVPVGSDGTIQVLNAAGASSDVIVDVVGYYSPAGRSAYLPVTPTRLLDTRDTTKWQYGPVAPWSYVYMPVSGQPDITAFALNATMTNTTSDGHLSVAPDPNTLTQYAQNTFAPLSPPSVSSLNWTAGGTVPNLVQTPTGANNIIDFWNGAGGTSDLIVDMFGFYQNN